jgi:hypothetical protein
LVIWLKLIYNIIMKFLFNIKKNFIQCQYI